jgi:uncharacterized protein YndB with AHSA1/START domain
MAKFDQSIDIKAPVDTVWSILTNPGQWPLWFPDVQSVSGLPAVQTGATFQWQSGSRGAGTGSVVRAEPQRRLQVVTKMDENQATHTFEVSQRRGLLGGSGARFHYVLEFKSAGGLIGEVVAGGNPVDLLKVKNAVTKVRDLAQREAGRR